MIFPKTEITQLLRLTKQEYDKASILSGRVSGRKMRLYYCAAVIALSGWLEDNMNKVARIPMRGLDAQRQQRLERKLKVNGASYEHFTRRLEVAYGSHGLAYIERTVGDSDIARLQSKLGNLKTMRDDVSHSLSVVIRRPPNDLLGDFVLVHPILKRFEQAARQYAKDHL